MNFSVFNVVMQNTLRAAKEIYETARVNGWEDTLEYIDYLDELNALSVKYSEDEEVKEKIKVDKQKK